MRGLLRPTLNIPKPPSRSRKRLPSASQRCAPSRAHPRAVEADRLEHARELRVDRARPQLEALAPTRLDELADAEAARGAGQGRLHRPDCNARRPVPLPDSQRVEPHGRPPSPRRPGTTTRRTSSGTSARSRPRSRPARPCSRSAVGARGTYQLLVGLVFMGAFAVGAALLLRAGWRVPGGVLAVATVAMVPTVGQAFERLIGVWPNVLEDGLGILEDFKGGALRARARDDRRRADRLRGSSASPSSSSTVTLAVVVRRRSSSCRRSWTSRASTTARRASS